MKKFISVLLCAIMIFAFTGCDGKENTGDANTHKENGVTITTDAFKEGTVLKVDRVKEGDEKYKAYVKDALAIETYDITAKSDNVTVQPNGKVEVTFPIPAEYSAKKHNVAVYYISNSGKGELMPTKVGIKTVTATLTHFSIYAVVLTSKNTEALTSSEVDASNTQSAADTSSAPEISSNPNTAFKPTSSKPASSKPSQSSAESIIPVSIKGKTLSGINPRGKDTVYNVTLTLGSKVEVGLGIGDSMEVFYHNIIEGSAGDIPTFEEVLDQYKNDCIQYGGKYYYVGRGDGNEYNLTGITIGEAVLELDGEVGSFKYETIGKNKVKITEVKGKNGIADFIAAGDIFTVK